MRLLLTLLACCFFCSPGMLSAQVPKDITIPITATVNASPTSITLSWPNSGADSLLLIRRVKGQAGNAWQLVFYLYNTNLTTVTDNGAANGQVYEYMLQRASGGLFSVGYVHVAVNANPVNSRGKILVVIDSTTADAAGVELVRMKNDMRGDGWWPIPIKVGPAATPQSVKAQILQAYNADPTNLKAVLLIGNVPVPYSGNAAWDGHSEHAGAWPADAYYADVNGNWTDASVNNSTPARAANKNVPGDGKFDQSFIPSLAELQVGRIDFRRLDPATFGATDHLALLKRYLEKNHRWRTGQYTVDNKALVDDNFGFFGGEAFAANGYRNAYPLVGEANVVATDFFDGTESQSYLMGYGTGGGSYTSASGVGSSDNFATDSVNIVFTNLFGSYHGDWDYESNPFMPSALASRGGILTCSWAGRPHHFTHSLASGETMGYAMLETLNAAYNLGFYGSSGESGAHVALLGDPTLRAHVVKPATNLTAASPNCNSVLLNWTASAETVSGYHVYRSLSQDGPYTRLTPTPITATTYTDNAPVLDTLYFQVRAIKSQSSPGGGTYANNAVGPIVQHVFTAAGGPSVVTTGGTITCNELTVMLTANATPASITSWAWSGPNNFSSNQQNPTVNIPGNYTVTATDAMGCKGTATALVTLNATPPILDVTVSNVLDCNNPTATISVNVGGLSSCTISGPGGLFTTDHSVTVSLPGAYTITGVSSINGCMASKVVIVAQNILAPSAAASNDGPITCVKGSTQLSVNTSMMSTAVWSGPCFINPSTALCSGIYTVTVTGSNGCTNTASTEVLQDTNPPTVVAEAGGVLTCAVTAVPLTAMVNPPNASVLWTGPCLNMSMPPMATCPGTYNVLATSTVNGCTASVGVQVTEDKTAPNISLQPATLNCLTPCATLTVPNIPGVQLCLAGQPLPPGFTMEICQPGVFTLQAKSLTTGCSSDVQMVIQQDVNVPVCNAGPDKILSCSTPSVQLDGSGSSLGANFTYLWTGPGGFSSTQIMPSVSVVGMYVLLVTNTQNGCTATDVTVVSADGSLPVVNATASGQLNCANTSVQLQSGNNDPGASYAWSPAAGLSCTTCPNPLASQPGVYTVVVTVGACTATDAVEVGKAPDLQVGVDPVVLECNQSLLETCIHVTGGTPPYAILWSNGVTNDCATFSLPATVSVKVTDSGGCSFESLPITVIATPPIVAASEVSILDCDTKKVCLAISGGVPPYTIEWSNGGTGLCADFDGSGTLLATITDAAGCQFVVNHNIIGTPSISLTAVSTDEVLPGGSNGTIDLTALGGTGPFIYLWSNNATTQDLTGLNAGVYTVTATDANGCTKTLSATINLINSVSEADVFEQFVLSPNPTAGEASLVLKLRDAAEIQVEVRDVTGRLVWVSSTQPVTDVLTLPLDLRQQPAGMYTVAVRVENHVFSRKLAVIR